MLKFDGAFTPTQRCNGFYRPNICPPKRFVAAQLSGGLKRLYKHLGNKKKNRHQGHVPGSQTDEDGKFQPCYPVPLLASRYKFVQVIGQGQSAVMVAAEDTFHPDKRPVAVKVMNLDYTHLGAQEAEFIRQLNKADDLKVSRTVQLFNMFSFDCHYCLVFELLRPKSLHQYFLRCQFENEETKLKVIRKIALQLLQGLGFLKRENVIHTDLKPENILIEEGEEIKIKVVDFGNAIHYVHREVSLYYDEFELQTLVYRSPEVMFGIPFGHEIDMWSVGCVLAELHIGKPLFLGRTKHEILQQVTSILGPFPRNPFQSGKFFQDLSEFVGQNPEANQPILVTKMMKNILNSRNYAFASFLIGLLQYNPSERFSPCQAAMHPFIAPDFPFCYLLPQHGDKITDASSSYTSVLLTPDQYTSKPDIDEQVKRQQFSGTELLKRGTKVLYGDVNIDHQVSSSVTKQKKENDVKGCSSGAAVNTGNKRTSNTAVTSKTKPRHKRKTCSVGTDKYDKPVHRNNLALGSPKHKKNRLSKTDDQKTPNVANISPRENWITDSYNDLERSTLTEKSPQAVSATDEYDECKERSQFFSEDARERMSQHSKAVSNGGPQHGYRSNDTQVHTEDPEYQEQSQLVKKSRVKPKRRGTKLMYPRIAKSKKEREKVRRDPIEQDSVERPGCSDEYQDDVVILL